MRVRRLISTLVGIAILIGIVAYYGIDEVRSSFATVGFGIGWVFLAHALPLGLNTVGWHVLFRRLERPPFLSALFARWVGESANNLLPVAQVGGDWLRARLVGNPSGVRTRAGATVVVDVTAGLIAQTTYALGGILWLGFARGAARSPSAVWAALALLGGGVLFLVAVQRTGILVKLTRAAARRAASSEREELFGDAEALAAQVLALHRRRSALALCFGLRLAGWISGAAETWIALALLGHRTAVLDVLALQSLAELVRSAGFLVPGAVGVQESGYVVIGPLVGIPPGIALSVGLIRRVREIILGLPALAIAVHRGTLAPWTRRAP